MAPVAVASAPAPDSKQPAAVDATAALKQLRLSESSAHPLDPLSSDEISAGGSAVRAFFTSGVGDSNAPKLKVFKIGYLTLVEPPKLAVLASLGIPTSVGSAPETVEVIKRKAGAAVIDELTGDAYEVSVEYSGGEAKVTDFVKLPAGVQPGITLEELVDCEETVRNDPVVQKLGKDIGLEPHQLWCDGWSIGYDVRFGPNRRLQQCMMYARFSQHDNLYAHPLDFSPVVDSNLHKVIHIDFPAHRTKAGELSNADTTPYQPLSVSDPTIESVEEALKHSARERIKPPMKEYEYLPELSKVDLRQDLKPFHVVQPEGVSFKLNGNRIQWQKWDFHIGFNYREGIVLSTITYDARPVVYRMSLCEMVVPYGAPEWPHPRKMAFDVGEYGLGTLANSLALGCDCLGEIKYMDAHLVKHDGTAYSIENAICIHEEDDGLLWKHSDFRPGGKSRTVRSRKLVISMLCTVANYEYFFYYNFFQDGTIELEIKLSGILNIYTLAPGETSGGYGTQVAPQINAHYHQHLFSLRVDPMIDGLSNSVVEQDIVPSPHPTGSRENFAGNAFGIEKTTLKSSTEAVRDWDASKGRTWSIVNQSKKHYASGDPVGYKIICKDLPILLSKPDSIVAKRAPFSRHHLFVTPYTEGQFYPAGKNVPQTIEEPEDSILKWAAKDTNVENEDIVVYLTWGTTHIPRPEDFPVMPVEHLSARLKPVGFFDQNPSLDVPEVKDLKSKLALNGHGNGTKEESCGCP